MFLGEITDFCKTVEVGPLANPGELAAGRESTQNKLNEIVAIYQKLTGNTLEVAQLHSTLAVLLVVPFTAVNSRISCKTNTVH
ncbi:hypothetical protein ACNKHU_18475 [Shigella flexneri]